MVFKGFQKKILSKNKIFSKKIFIHKRYFFKKIFFKKKMFSKTFYHVEEICFQKKKKFVIFSSLFKGPRIFAKKKCFQK